MHILGVLETSLYVPDLDAAASFYSQILGLEEITREPGRHVFFRCGAGVLLLFNPEKTRQSGDDVPPHGAVGPCHIAFAVPEEEIPRWKEHLSACGIPIEREIAWPHGGHSIYFRDPAGHSVELASPSIWRIGD